MRRRPALSRDARRRLRLIAFVVKRSRLTKGKRGAILSGMDRTLAAIGVLLIGICGLLVCLVLMAMVIAALV